MLSSARNSARTLAVRPSGPPRFARVILVLAWAVFWLSTALFPCCEVVAAVLGGHAETGSQPVATTQSAHHPDTAHAETSDHSPDLPCSDTLISGLSVAGGHEILTPERSPPSVVRRRYACCPGFCYGRLLGILRPARVATTAAASLLPAHSVPADLALFMGTSTEALTPVDVRFLGWAMPLLLMPTL
jgi:hypothetical protein